MEGASVARIVNCVLAIPTSLTAVAGNLLVLISIWKTPSLHDPSIILLFNLALADFCVGLVVQPVFVAFNISEIQGWNNVTEATQNILFAVAPCLSGLSFFTLTIISLDRFIAIRFHLRYKEIVTIRRVISLLVLIWLGLLTSAATSLLRVQDFARSKPTRYFRHAIAGTCLLVTTLAYCWIYKVVRRHQRAIRAQVPAQQSPNGTANMPQLKKSTWNMLLIYLVFVCFYLGNAILQVVITSSGTSNVKKSAFEVAAGCVFINSSLNPILYCWRMEGIRKAVSRTISTFCS